MRFTDPTGHYIVEEEDCTQLSCSGDPVYAPHILREQGDEPENWDELTDGEQSSLMAAGIGEGFWQDVFFGNARDVGGTWSDPGVYISVTIALSVTGLPQHLAAATAYACLSSMTCASIIARTIGISVFRVWGGESTPFGQYWAFTNPLKVANYAKFAGLPTTNAGEYLTIGRISSMQGVSISIAPGIGSDPGGIMQYIIANRQAQVTVELVCMVVPGFC